MAELRGLGEVNAELQQAGGTVLAISADPPKRAAEVVSGNKLPFPVLCDTELRAARAFGVLHPGGRAGRDIALPASFLIDRSGRIVWEQVARRVQDRPQPEEVLARVRELVRRD
jgi:peroxiredoxin